MKYVVFSTVHCSVYVILTKSGNPEKTKLFVFLSRSRSKITNKSLRLPGTYDAKIDENQTPLTRFPQ